MNDLCHHISCPLNKEKLFNAYKILREGNPNGQEYKYAVANKASASKKVISFLWVYNLSSLDEFEDSELIAQAKSFLNHLGVNETPVFTYLALQPHQTLGWHVDDALCSINFVLTATKDPVIFENCTFNYETALLDVSQRHKVKTSDVLRVLFRFSFRKHSFADVKNKLETFV